MENVRDRIVAAASDVIVRDGYIPTTIKSIANEAGVAPGLIHYYFSSKEELMVAAVRCECRRIGEQRSGTPPPGLEEAFQMMKASILEDRRFYTLLIRMVGIALENGAIAAEVSTFIRELREYVESVLATAFSKRDAAASNITSTAAAICGSLLGIAIQDQLEEGFNTDGAVEALIGWAMKEE